MESLRDRVNPEFIDHSQIQQIKQRQSKLSFKGIVDWYSVFSVFVNEKTVFEKPIYLGFIVLELNKLPMYEFFHKTSEPHWQNQVQLHYMVTDSFFLSQLENLIEFLKQSKDEFDFSELDKHHQLYNLTNKKVIRKMKIETSPVLVLDSFTALQSKSYSFSYNGFQKAKPRRIRNAPECGDYTRCLFVSETTSATIYSFRSSLHSITVEKQNKLALNPFHDKRVYLNPIQSLSWDKHTQKGCVYVYIYIYIYPSFLLQPVL